MVGEMLGCRLVVLEVDASEDSFRKGVHFPAVGDGTRTDKTRAVPVLAFRAGS